MFTDRMQEVIYEVFLQKQMRKPKHPIKPLDLIGSLQEQIAMKLQSTESRSRNSGQILQQKAWVEEIII